MYSALLGTVLTPLFVQWAEASLLPSEPLPLGGYTERGNATFQPGGDDLKVRCMMLTQGGVRLAVVVLEALTIPESLYEAVKARVPEGTHLFLHATHTHCAPDSQMLNDRMTFQVPGIATFKRRWLDWYADAISRCVLEASRSNRTASRTIEIIHKRLGLNRGRRKGAKPDTLYTDVVLGGSFSIANYAAHPVFFGPDELKLRGDWPGRVMAFPHGGRLLLNGAIGDVSPVADGATPEARAQTMADALNAAGASRGTHLQMGHSALRWASAPIVLGKPVPHPTFAAANKVPEAFAQIAVSKFAPSSAAAYGFRIGKVAVIGVSGEPTAELGRRIVRAGKNIGFESVMVVSHVNGWMGYVLTAEDYARGGYEATLAFHGPGAGDALVSGAVECLQELAVR